MTIEQSARHRLDSLTSLRFFAALAVVLSHTTRDLAPVPILSIFASNGYVGVGFFFALSGFVLTWSHRTGDTPGRFYRRRFARVYPLHAATYLLAFPILLFFGANMDSSSVNPIAAIANPLLLQAWFPGQDIQFGMNGPSWSLSNEAFFYLLFPALLPLVVRLSRRWLSAGLILILAIDVVGSVLLLRWIGGGAVDGLYVNPAWRLLEFLAGMFLARLVRTRARVLPSLPVAAVAALLAFLSLAALKEAPFHAAAVSSFGFADALMLPFFVILIGAAAQSDLADRRSVLRGRKLVNLGKWSFALYLTHWLLINAVSGILPNTLAAKTWVLALLLNIVIVIVAVVIAKYSYILVEMPLEKLLRESRPRVD